MEQKFLTALDFYQEIDKVKNNKEELKKFINNIKKKYIIPEAEQKGVINTNNKYSETYIVNDSKKRFKSEIENSHYLYHFSDLCKYPEIMSVLRFMYNLINVRKNDFINFLYEISSTFTTNNIILSENIPYFDELNFKLILDFLGLKKVQISRIKIFNESLSNNFKIYEPSEIKYNCKMAINYQMIINLQQEYPRNLITCRPDKVVLAERYNKINSGTYYFVCHKNNMISGLKTDKLCLSVWLIKNLNKETNKWETSLKMGTAYLTDTFPGENGTINDFINDVKNNGLSEPSTKFLNNFNENIQKQFYNAIEVYEPFFEHLNPNRFDNKSNLSLSSKSESSFKFSKKLKKWKSKNKNQRSKIKKLLNSNNFF
jgi:hypothetical protein